MNSTNIEIMALVKGLLTDAIDEAEASISESPDTVLSKSAARLLTIDAAHIKVWMQENGKTSFDVFTGTDLRMTITFDKLPF